MTARRDFIKGGLLAGLAGIAGKLASSPSFSAITALGGDTKFTLPPLPYAYEALEPHIDKETMRIHHDKHHQGYVDKLNTVPAAEIDFSISDADKCRKITASSSALLRNNLGGHVNHSMFWEMMRPAGSSQEIPDALSKAINEKFGSAEQFRNEFAAKAGSVFGSGWCWLILNKDHHLQITTTPNQDNPLMQVAEVQGKPVLGLDVWEHAYYLKHQNRRAEYIASWWNVVNWEKAAALYQA